MAVDADATLSSWTLVRGLDPGVVYEMRLAVWSDADSDDGGGSTATAAASVSTGPVQLVRVGTRQGPPGGTRGAWVGLPVLPINCNQLTTV